MEESTAFIWTGRPGQVIKQALSLFSYTATGLKVLQVFESVSFYLPFSASLLHLFSHFLIKAGAKDDSTVCLLSCFKDKV